MTLVLAAKPGLCIDMSQTNQQEQGAARAKPRVRKDLELFWRIIAGLLVVIIAWILWVLYQISPRSVVTPLVYAYQVKPVGTQQSATAAAGTIASPQSPAAAPASQAGATAVAVPQASPEAAAAALAMDQAQAGARSGAHQASADIQAAALDERNEQLQRAEPLERDGLKLSPEITTPLVGKKRIPTQ
jgi:hypothetical protein